MVAAILEKSRRLRVMLSVLFGMKKKLLYSPGRDPRLFSARSARAEKSCDRDRTGNGAGANAKAKSCSRKRRHPLPDQRPGATQITSPRGRYQQPYAVLSRFGIKSAVALARA